MPQYKFTRREILKLFSNLLIGGYTTFRAGLLYSVLVETEWIDVHHVILELPRLSQKFNGYRIAQISDIHFDDWMTPQRFSPIVDMVNNERPDSIVITGDIIYRDQKHQKVEIIEEFNRLNPIEESYGILGNHDHWVDAEFVESVFDESGVIVLNNKVQTITKGDSHFYLCGLDDYWERKNRLDLVLETLPDEDCAILLVHEPDYADISAQTGRFDLQISGHSHGGQVNIPFYGPPIVPPYARKYPSGLYQIQNMYLYTNRGIGMLKPRVRFNCRPEITVYNLYSPDRS